MSLTSLFYYNDQWAKTDPNVSSLVWKITAAKTVQSIPIGPPVLATFDALTQLQIDTFLGTTLEFNLLQFDATSLGTDAFGAIINMNGQASIPVAAEISLYPTAAVQVAANTVGQGPPVTVSTSLSHQHAAWFPTLISDSSLAANIQYQIGAYGNLAVKTVLPGIDALTTCLVVLKFYWISK